MQNLEKPSEIRQKPSKNCKNLHETYTRPIETLCKIRVKPIGKSYKIPCKACQNLYKIQEKPV